MEEGADGGDFLPLSECHAALIDAYPWDASEKLLSALRDGEIRAVADRSLIFSGDSVSTHDGHQVPVWVWQSVIKPNVDYRSSALDANEQRGNRRVKLRGIKCAAADFRTIFGEALAATTDPEGQSKVTAVDASIDGEPTDPPRRGGGGRRPDKAGWTRFSVALAVWVSRRDDTAAGIAAVGTEEVLKELDQIAMNELPEHLRGDLPRTTYQDAVAAFNETFHHLAGN